MVTSERDRERPDIGYIRERESLTLISSERERPDRGCTRERERERET